MSKKPSYSEELDDLFEVLRMRLLAANCIEIAGPIVIRRLAREVLAPDHPNHWALQFLDQDAPQTKTVLLRLIQKIVNAEARLVAAKRSAGENVKNRIDATILPFECKNAARRRIELRG